MTMSDTQPQPQAGSRNLPSLEVLAEIAAAAVGLTTGSIALVQAVRTYKRQDHRGKGENTGEQ